MIRVLAQSKVITCNQRTESKLTIGLGKLKLL